MVLQSSTAELLVIGWFSGRRQEIAIRPTSPRQLKQLKRALKYKRLDLADFGLQVGLPTRVLKITSAPDRQEVNLLSICVPNGLLDQPALIKALQEALKLDVPADQVEVLRRRAGDCIETLVRFWL